MINQCKYDPLVLKRLKPVFEDLKRKIDMTKAHNRWIRSILPQENKTELMIHEFELVKDTFKEVYNKQQKIRQKIGKIEQLKGRKINDEVRKSFMSEVGSLIHRYEG
jgi:hypothetical protein